MNEDENGRWITHDGSPCPCRGRKVEIEHANGNRFVIIAGNASLSPKGVPSFRRSNSSKPTLWEWAGPRANEIPAPFRIVRYRFIKPDAFLDLERAAEIGTTTDRVLENF